MEQDIQKGKSLPIGTERTRGGNVFVKTADGWKYKRRVTTSQAQKDENDRQRAKKQAQKKEKVGKQTREKFAKHKQKKAASKKEAGKTSWSDVSDEELSAAYEGNMGTQHAKATKDFKDIHKELLRREKDPKSSFYVGDESEEEKNDPKSFKDVTPKKYKELSDKERELYIEEVAQHQAQSDSRRFMGAEYSPDWMNRFSENKNAWHNANKGTLYDDDNRKARNELDDAIDERRREIRREKRDVLKKETSKLDMNKVYGEALGNDGRASYYDIADNVPNVISNLEIAIDREGNEAAKKTLEKELATYQKIQELLSRSKVGTYL